jgi:hypothetical protein
MREYSNVGLIKSKVHSLQVENEMSYIKNFLQFNEF